MEIQKSDLQKVYNTLEKVVEFLKLRDEMNATLHLGVPIYSPLTVNAMAELERLSKLLKEKGSE